MRIGVDARPLTVPTFGIGRYTSELLSRLMTDSPHEWFLYADRPMPPSWGQHSNIRQFRSHVRALSIARTQLTFAHWAVRDKLDVFWSPRHHLPLLLDRDIKQVVTVHDLVWQRFPETMRRANWLVERAFMAKSVANADAVISVSHATKQDLVGGLSIDPSCIQVVHEAADVKQINFDESEIADPYFLFIGTNEPRKNLPRLLAAHRSYVASGGDADLVIVGGKGWRSSDIIQERVLVLGYVDDFRLDGLIRHAHALLLPSLYEGFGLPLLEAIGRAVPVISGNVSAMPEVVGNAGILVNPEDESEICRAMLRMSSVGVRQDLVNQCEAQAAKFSWDLATRQTLAVLESAVV